jgi:hypothetical protein
MSRFRAMEAAPDRQFPYDQNTDYLLGVNMPDRRSCGEESGTGAKRVLRRRKQKRPAFARRLHFARRGT